jgi:hypothetical protein
MGLHPIPHQGVHTLEPVCFCVRDVEIDGFVMRVYRDKQTKEIGNAHFKIGEDK